MSEATKEAKPVLNAAEIARNEFLSISEVDVTLTYAWAKEPIVWRFGLLMNEDQLEMRQAFYAQPAADQAAGKHAYHVEMIASMLKARPKGLPGFGPNLTHQGDPIDDVRKAVKEYFAGGEPLALKIAADTINRYNQIVEPEEFF